MAVNVVLAGNLGSTIKADLVNSKYEVNIDGTTITKNGAGVLSAVPFDASTIESDISELFDRALALRQTLGTGGVYDENLGTFAGTLIPDNQTVKQAIQTLETAYQNINIVGQFAGSAATFAGLPTTTSDGKPINGSDWAILTTDDGANQAGIYVYNGTAYVLAAEIPDQFAQAATAISPKANDAVGAIGTSLKYAREDHKHAAQSPSADSGNLLTTGADGLHYLGSTGVTTLALNAVSANIDVELQDAFGVTVGYLFSTDTLV